MGEGEANPVRFTRAAFEQLVADGAVGEDERVELIEGAIVTMSPVGPPHRAIVQALNRWFSRNLPAEYECQVQDPIALSEATEPQPDIAIVRFREDEYVGGHPSARDVLLVIEVADSSLEFDRGTKARLYARGGVPEYWVVDVPQRVVYVHRSAGPQGYGEIRTIRPPARIDLSQIPGLAVPLDQIIR